MNKFETISKGGILKEVYGDQEARNIQQNALLSKLKKLKKTKIGEQFSNEEEILNEVENNSSGNR
jgi:hypothetical protein